MDTTAKFGAGLASGAVIAAGVLGFLARRAGISFPAQLVRSVAIPLLNPAAWFADEASIRKTAAADRKKGPSLPSAKLRQKYRFEDTDIGGRTFILAPKGAASKRGILYLHGGAYITDLAPLHWTVIEALVDRIKAEVVIPIYPLAPDHDWQTGFAMAKAAYDRLVENFGAGSVTIAGDSAGGGFALALAQVLRDEGRSMPAALLLFSPWADVRMSDPGQLEIEKRDPMLRIEGGRAAGAMWAGATQTTDPKISPLFGSLDDLPPLAIFTGTNDILNSDAHRLAAKAETTSTSLELFEYQNMFHVWMLLGIPEGKRCLDQAITFLLRHLEPIKA